MIDQVRALLRKRHIDWRALQPIADGIDYLPIRPEHADALWQVFRHAVAETGHWPVLSTAHVTQWLAKNLHYEPLLPSAVAIQEIEQLDPLAWLHEQGSGDPFYRYPSSVWPEDRWCDDVLAHHDELYRAHMAALGEEIDAEVQDGTTAEWQRYQRWDAEGEALNSSAGGADALIFIRSTVGWDIPMMLGFGDTSRSPEPAVHSALLKRWSEEYGADLHALSYDWLALRARSRPNTRRDALRLAWEHQQYGPADDSYPPLPYRASQLLRTDLWTFWWD